MIAELLEKFEDLFTPHSEDEVKKRTPVNAVVILVDLYWDSKRRKYSCYGRRFNYPDQDVITKGTIMVPSDAIGASSGEYMTLDDESFVDYASLEPEWYKPYHTSQD